MRIRTLTYPAVLTLITLATSGCQSTPPATTEATPPPPRTLPGPVTAAAAGATLQGRITTLDLPTRAVTITGSDGSALDIIAGPEVRNFNQLKVGDNVTLDYRAAVALDLKPAGSAPIGVTTSQAGTVPIRGAVPGGARSNTVDIVTEVAAVNPTANTIALRGPKGNTQIIAVEREDLRAKLPNIKRGDLLRISYTEAIALGIRRDSP